MLPCYFVLFLISASSAFVISAPRSVKSEASATWSRNNGDPDDSVFALRLLPDEVGDQLPESPGSLPSGTIDVQFPVAGTYLIEIRTPQPEFRLLAQSDTILANFDPADNSTSVNNGESAITVETTTTATSTSISSTVQLSSSTTTRNIQSQRITVSESDLQNTSTSGPVTVLGVITITATPSSSLSTAPLSTLVPMPVKTTNQNVSVITNTPTSTTQVITSTSRTNTSSISSSGHNVGATSILESTSVLSAFSKLVTDTPNQTNTDLPRPTTSIPSASSQSSRSHIPQIIGGTLGSFLSIILLIGLFIFYRRRWRRSWQLPSSRSPDTEKQKEFEAPSRSESMVQPLTRPESYTSTSTSPFSPLSQHTFYLSYTDGFLRRLDSDPHRHDRDASVASSSSHLTARQFLLHERASSLRDEADWLRQTISFVTSSDHIVGELQATIWRLEEHVRRLEAEHESDWALYQSDEPPPVYMEAIRRSQSNSHSENI